MLWLAAGSEYWSAGVPRGVPTAKTALYPPEGCSPSSARFLAACVRALAAASDFLRAANLVSWFFWRSCAIEHTSDVRDEPRRYSLQRRDRLHCTCAVRLASSSSASCSRSLCCALRSRRSQKHFSKHRGHTRECLQPRHMKQQASLCIYFASIFSVPSHTGFGFRMQCEFDARFMECSLRSEGRRDE